MSIILSLLGTLGLSFSWGELPGTVRDVLPGTTTSSIAAAAPTSTDSALVAGGCFWCVEADLEKLPGVIEAVSGYAGGTSDTPSYETYAAAGHREVVEVTYDPATVSYEEILIYTMKHMDPTDDIGSFGDRGEHYSPAFYYETPGEQRVIEDLIAEVDARGPYEAPLAIDVERRPDFYPAEEYHQNYYQGLSRLRYEVYRRASGRDAFIERHWGSNTSPTLPWREVGLEPTAASAAATASSSTSSPTATTTTMQHPWTMYEKPSPEVLEEQLDPLVYRVTQQEGTERAGTSPLDKNDEPGIYVDVLSGEPLFSSKHKYDSGTGWPSFTQPITPEAVTEHEDRKLFSVRTEIRSAIADNHLGHVFTDGPADRGGLRYCMNGAALEFVPEAEMAARGYGDYLDAI